jgi:glycopeptide antibiotics resistance protein
MRKVVRSLLWVLFVFYCLILIDVLFISRPVRPHLSYPDYFKEYTNFIPFRTVGAFVQGFWNDLQCLLTGEPVLGRGWAYYVINLIGNFALFLPMGMALPFLIKKLDRFWKVTLVIFGLIVLVELMQGVLRVGSIDIDDLIFNLCGGMLGYGIVKLLGFTGLWRKLGLEAP